MGWFMDRWTPPPPPPSLPIEKKEFPTPPEGIKLKFAIAQLNMSEYSKKFGIELWLGITSGLEFLEMNMFPNSFANVAFYDTRTMKTVGILQIFFVPIPDIKDELDTSFKWEIPKSVNIKKENV